MSVSTFPVQEIWQQACLLLKETLSQQSYQTWILSNPLTEFRQVGENRAIGVITSPTAFHATNIEKNFYAQIKEVLDHITGLNSELQFRVGTPFTSSQQTFQPFSQVPPNYQDSPRQTFASTATPSSHIPSEEGRHQPLSFTSPFRSAELDSSAATSSATPGFSQASPPPQPMVNDIQERLRQLAQRPQTAHSQNSYSSQPQSSFSRPAATPQFMPGELFATSTLQSVAVDRARVQAQRAGLRPDFTFETFAVSSTNEMAYAAAQAVSNQPGTAYNPLFIYGGVGVGKTHLIHAIGNNIIKNNPDSRVLYCTGEDFTNEIVNAIRTKKTLIFKEKFRTANILIIDDIQFIAGKNTVQEEFFHTFNTITKQLGQIILTSDRSPSEINLLEDRLRSRFEAGLMVDIQQPSFELRTAILLIKAQAYQIPLQMNLAQHIASKVDSARRLEGLMKSLKSEVELKQREVTPELVEELLRTGDEERVKPRLRLKPYDVIKGVADYYHLKMVIVRGQQRIKSYVRARHLAMYILKEELRLPLAEIGRWFSNRDHTSALHAVRKIEEDLLQDDDLRQELNEVLAVLRKASS